MSVALVTGGASGLGLATAQALHADGFDVVILDLPRAAELAREYEHLTFAPADVRRPDEVQAAIDTATQRGDLRVAVNCAGIGTATRVVRKGEAHPLDEFQRIIDVNLVGTFNVLRLAAKTMAVNEVEEGDRGVIINTASIAAYDGQIGQAAYAASKGGIVSLTLAAARDLAQSAIRCVTIAPGLFNTPLFATLPKEACDALSASVPHPSRLGEPVEYAALATHIVQNRMLNGEVIRLDGALRMAPR
jgi:NAD(P)-dependent dehydrogenase (short-subunit alcohol dehydrogenase family)